MADKFVKVCNRAPESLARFLVRIPGTPDPKLHAVHVGDGLNVVVRASDQGHVVGVLWVGPQDKVSRWAAKQPATVQRTPKLPVAVAVRSEPRTNDDPLSSPLTFIGLPALMENWADRAGVRTLGELVLRHPAELARERRLGEVSIRETRKIIRKLTGLEWESLARAPDGFGAEPGAKGERGWDVLRETLSDQERALDLESIALSPALRVYAEDLELRSLGDLAERSSRDLLEVSSVGRAKLKALEVAVAARLEDESSRAERAAELSERERALAEAGLLESFERMVEQLDPVPRAVLERRSGLRGKPETLQQIGAAFGFSRERTRQYQARVVEQMTKRPWAAHVRARVAAALREGGSPIADLRTDRWWRRATRNPAATRFILEQVLAVAHVATIGRRKWISAVSGSGIDATAARMRAAVESLALPCSLRDAEAAALRAAAPMGAQVAKALWPSVVRGLELTLHGEEPNIIAAGRTLRSRVLAILHASDRPLAIAEIVGAIGYRCRLPDEVIHFDKGVVGLREHFPRFHEWARRLVPKAEAIVKLRGARWQWSCAELMVELRRSERIPRWLTPWCLAALIRAGSELHYLGRLQVALR